MISEKEEEDEDEAVTLVLRDIRVAECHVRKLWLNGDPKLNVWLYYLSDVRVAFIYVLFM